MAALQLGPSEVDLLGIRAGDRNVVTVELTSDGAPWDLTGAALRAQARKTATDADPALEAVVTAVDEAGGLFEVSWDGEEVRTLLGADVTWEGVWDLQVVEVGQTLAETVAAGKVTMVLDVTR